MRKVSIIFAALLTLLACRSLNGIAQETTADILGTVSDGKTGLAGATIVAVHTPSGTKYTTTSRSDGRFNIVNVRIGGPYTITVSYVGFKEQKQENVFLALGQSFKSDFTMVDANATLTEVVIATRRQDNVFNTSHTGTQEIVTRSQLERLPTVNRSLQDFTKLTPTANGLAFGGQSNQYNNLTIDGANFNNSFGLSGTLGGQTNSQPISLDALEQIQVNVSPYDVRQGGFSGAGINAVTRSGTNDFKGSVYTYIKSAGMLGYNVRTIKVPRQDLSYNLRGASLGGPIIPNKLFFFVSGEQERRTDPGTVFVASDATHIANGVSVSNANATLLQALADTLKNRFGYDPGAFQGYSYKTQSDKLTVKFDLNINTNNTLSLKYNYLKSSREIQASNSGAANTSYGRTPGQYGMPFYGSGYKQFNNFNIFIAELNSRFSSKLSNKLQIGYTALRDYRTPLTGSQSKGSYSGQYFPLVDILDGNGGTNPLTSFGYEQYTYGNKLNTDVYQLNDILTYFAGAHELTFGFQGSSKKYQNGFSPAYEGVYRFNSLADFYASLNGTKAAARYDLSYTLNSDGSFPLVGPKDLELGVFAQDKWKIKPNFTLTYGVRFDMPFFKNTFLYNPVVDTLTKFYNNIHVNTGQGPGNNLQVSPRVGFNWDVTSDHKTQVRGGIGLFAGPPPFVWISNQASNTGMALFGSISNGTGYMFSPDVNKYRPTNASATLSSSYSINVTDPKFKFPQALKSSLGIDHRFGNDLVVTAEFAYAKDVNAAFFQNINQPSTGIAINNGSDNRVRYTGSKIYASGANANNPNIGNAIYMTNVNGGYAYTATLQVKKTFRNLLTSVAYTYQQSKDVMVGGSTAATMWGTKPTMGDPNSPEVGYSNAYLPHRVIAYASYRVDYAKHFATSVGLYFEAAPSGVGSYVYNGDLNNDSYGANDLMYIPTAADISNYVANGQLEAAGPTTVVTYNSNGTTTTSSVNDPRTPAQIGAQLNNYITQDPYLSKHRGEVARRNALIYPWFKRLDLNVTQDIYFTQSDRSKMKHTLRFSVDIYNFGNMLNKNWGIQRGPIAGSGTAVQSVSIMKYDKMAADGKTPIFSVPYSDGGNLVPYASSFKDDITTASRWQMQVGFRYLFN